MSDIREGAGKSSTIHLIERFFDPTSGQVFLDGQDIRKEAVRSHRARLALVVSCSRSGHGLYTSLSVERLVCQQSHAGEAAGQISFPHNPYTQRHTREIGLTQP